MTDQTDATSRQPDTISGTLHHPFDIKPLATVFDANRQATALALRCHLQMYPDEAIAQFIQARIALLIIAGKTRRIPFKAGVQAQYAMLQGVGVQFSQHRVERPALRPQPMDLQQQLQQIGQRVEAFERGRAKLETHRPVQRTALATVGIHQRRRAHLRRLQQADLDHAHVVTGFTAKIAQRLLDLCEQRIRLTIGGKHPLQSLDTEQLFVGIAGIDHTVG
ncbi:hypothetical protein D3C84_727820 [compost metagenome]